MTPIRRPASLPRDPSERSSIQSRRDWMLLLSEGSLGRDAGRRIGVIQPVAVVENTESCGDSVLRDQVVEDRLIESVPRITLEEALGLIHGEGDDVERGPRLG